MPMPVQSRRKSPKWSLDDDRHLLALYRRREILERENPPTKTVSSPPPSLCDYTESTVNFKLDPWQHRLCGILEGVEKTPGSRVLIHAPPQHGKSLLVSQRFPAWCLGKNPSLRVRLACYNITHATGFGWMIRDLMQAPEFLRAFPDPAARVPAGVSRGDWRTAAREGMRDAQPSFRALGLQTGFVGSGADLLLIDDPYASPQEVDSDKTRENVWTFWTKTAKPRLNDQTSVVVMFHRYREDDFAGRLLAEEPDEWTLYRFPALADAPDDPIGRALGEPLTPRYSLGFYGERRKDSVVWASQFQGTPIRETGNFFKPDQAELLDAAPIIRQVVRAWDLAATEGGGDYTVGVKMGCDTTGRYVILDVVRGQWGPDRVNATIKQTAVSDGVECHIRIPQDPASAGKNQVLMLSRLLAGYTVTAEPVTGDKSIRASPLASQVNVGNVRAVHGPWWPAFREELRAFPSGAHDDQVDAAADAFAELVLGAETGMWSIS